MAETLETKIVNWKNSKNDLKDRLLNLEGAETRSLQRAQGIVRTLLLNLGFFVVLYNPLAVLLTNKGNWPCFTAWIVVGIAVLFIIGVAFPVTIAWHKIKELRAEVLKLGDQRNHLKSTATRLFETLEELRRDLNSDSENMVEVQLDDVDRTKLTHIGQEPNDTMIQYNKQENLVKVICVSLGLYTSLFPVAAFILFCGDIKTMVNTVLTFLQHGGTFF